MRIAIIGGGAAGCFCAINTKRACPSADVHIYESGHKALAKVAITGGGRCNLTNTFRNVSNPKDVYPRGDKLMRRALSAFSNEDTCEWFENEGVRLVAQEDECIFPESQDAMEIVTTLLRLTNRLDIHLHLQSKVKSVRHTDNGSFSLNISRTTAEDNVSSEEFDKVVVTTGGHPKPSGFDMLSPLGLKIEPPVPSLFTFNIAGDWHQALMGTVVEETTASIAGTKFKAKGPLLLTHWGMSGPAILKLSAHAARYLSEKEYKGTLVVNWYGEQKESDVRQDIAEMMNNNHQKLITSVYPHHLTSKHWTVLLKRAGIPLTQRWGAINAKHINKLTTVLTADTYDITGKCPFKEEFVTCGGVSLSEININTLEAKRHPGLYFAGEVLDVDAVTGGFNLQAAWSMGFVVSRQLGQQ